MENRMNRILSIVIAALTPLAIATASLASSVPASANPATRGDSSAGRLQPLTSPFVLVKAQGTFRLDDGKLVIITSGLKKPWTLGQAQYVVNVIRREFPNVKLESIELFNGDVRQIAVHDREFLQWSVH